MDWDYDCGVIGAGPAGLMAALYLGRFLRKAVVFNSGESRAKWIPKTRNLIGFHRGISGPDLLSRLRLQAAHVGTDFIDSKAIVSRLTKGFEIESEGGSQIRVRKIVLATGMVDVQPPLPNLNELRELGLLRYCPICDVYDFRDQPLAVIANGSHGLREALFLSHFSQQVRVLIPSKLKIAQDLEDQLTYHSVGLIRDQLLAMEPIRSPKSIWLHFQKSAPFQARVAYVALGAQVNTQGFRHLRGLHYSEEGFIYTDRHQNLGIPGLFAAGDMVEGLAQISVAGAQAAIAATRIHNELRIDK